MITPIDVVDSAVKIGLGALVSGLATYWLARANHYKTVEKERAQHKRDMLEVIAQQVASYDQVVNKHRSVAVNWLHFSPEAEPMSDVKREEVTKLEAEFFEIKKEIVNAEARLLLLGEMKSYEILREYVSKALLIRLDLIARREVTVDRMRNYKEDIRQRREAFFSELSNVYKRI